MVAVLLHGTDVRVYSEGLGEWGGGCGVGRVGCGCGTRHFREKLITSHSYFLFSEDSIFKTSYVKDLVSFGQTFLTHRRVALEVRGQSSTGYAFQLDIVFDLCLKLYSPAEQPL